MNPNFKLTLKEINDTRKVWFLQVPNTDFKEIKCNKCGTIFSDTIDERIYYCIKNDMFFCRKCELKHPWLHPLCREDEHVHHFVRPMTDSFLGKLTIFLF